MEQSKNKTEVLPPAEMNQTASQAPAEMSFLTGKGFELMQRVASMFSKSSIVPKAYQGQLADCVIALDIARRLRANPLMVMQNLHIINGKPTFSSQFLIAVLNSCGRFSTVQYDFVGKQGTDDWGCRASVQELATKRTLTSPLVTIKMAKDEGWYNKTDRQGNNISKWKTMPELMLRYRATAFLVRTTVPELAMGLHTTDEIEDFSNE